MKFILMTIGFGMSGLSAFAIPAWGQSDAQTLLASPLTFNEAIAIALDAQPGEIAEVGLERVDGEVVIEIEVATEAGTEVEFHLHPETGRILSTWVDDDPGDDLDEEETTDTDG